VGRTPGEPEGPRSTKAHYTCRPYRCTEYICLCICCGLGKTRIRTTESLTTCMEPHRGWTIASSSWIFLQNQWLDREQELITVIQEETKRTEEKKEAGYRSPTWSILRALQKFNKAKRIEGEATMSAPPFFQSAGRGDLKFWGEDDGPTVVVWESLS